MPSTPQPLVRKEAITSDLNGVGKIHAFSQDCRQSHVLVAATEVVAVWGEEVKRGKTGLRLCIMES